MAQMTVTFEWDDDLGPRALNEDNLEILLYTKESTDKSLLRVHHVTFPDPSDKDRAWSL